MAGLRLPRLGSEVTQSVGHIDGRVEPARVAAAAYFDR